MRQDDTEARLRRAAAPVDAPELDAAVVSGAPGRPAPRLVRHGRVARATAASATALAAVTAGALVIANPFAPQAPLFLAAGSGAAGGAQEASALADSRMMLWIDYRYEAGAGLSTDGGRGSVYELRRAGTPESVLGGLAEHFGIAGGVSESPWTSADYPTWIVGPDDGSAPSVSLSWYGTGDWWYSDPGAYPEPVCVDVPVEGGAEGETWQDCSSPEVPASESLAPSTDEAKAYAAELFGVSPSAVEVTVDPWQTTASVNLVVDGVSTALVETVAWAPTGKIAWANGNSIEVVERGSYDTVSPVAGVDRLADGRWYGAAGPDYQGGVMFAADAMVRSENVDPVPGVVVDEPVEQPAEEGPAPADGEGDNGSAPGEGEEAPEIEEPQVIEPDILPGDVPEPEVVHVTLDTAEATLLLMWDVDGNAWLVPGWAYENPQGGFWNTVVSLVEGVIALPEPIAVEPLPAIID